MDFLRFHWGWILYWIIKLLKVFGIIPGVIAARWVQKFYQKQRQRRAMEGWPSTEATFNQQRFTRKDAATGPR